MGLINADKIAGCASAKYVLLGVGAVAGAVLVGRLIRDSKPLAVAAAKEGIAFSQWMGTQMAEGREFWEDVTAEAKHEYKEDVERKLEILQKQQAVLEKIKSKIEE